MKNKQTLGAAAVLIVLALLYFFTQMGATDTKSVDSNQFNFETTDIDMILVKTVLGQHEFKKTNEAWELDGYEVDSLKMNSFIKVMSTLPVDRLVTRKIEKQLVYELDDRGTSFEFLNQDKSTLLNLTIGKNGANYMETFVRENNSDDIYAVKAGLSQFKAFDTHNFWDRTISNFNVEEISRIDFSGNVAYTLERKGPVWSFNGSQVDWDKTIELLRPLSTLKANGFTEDEMENLSLYQSIKIQLESGELLDLNFYFKDAEATSLITTVNHKAKVFEYSKSGLNRFDKSLGDLQSDPIPPQ